MKRFLLLALLLLGFVCLYISCNKTDTSVQKIAPQSNTLVQTASAYFKSYISKNTYSTSQRTNTASKKEAIWGNACIKKYSIGDVVIVPLNYGENTYLYNNISGNEKLLANQVSSLLMYKDAKDSFHIEVVTSIPDSNCLRGSKHRFSGIISVQDWEGNAIKAFKYEDSKIIPLKPKSGNRAAREQVYCSFIDWYNCTDDYGCTYSHTTSDCYTYDDRGGGGGGDSGGGSRGGGPTGGDYGGSGITAYDASPDLIPCPSSFNFVTQGKWQSAVVANYKFSELNAMGTGQTYTVNIGLLEVGFPFLTYPQEEVYNAQEIATSAARVAERKTVIQVNFWVASTPGASPSQFPNQQFKLLFKSFYNDALNDELSKQYYNFQNINVARVSYDDKGFFVQDPTQYRTEKFPTGSDCQ